MAKSVIIVGAGIAGLSTGCYAQMNGFSTRILEAHDKPGGLCTSWKRKGYTFDGCIHHLAGSGPASTILHRMWQELGALAERQLVFHDNFVTVESPDGRAFTVHSDLDRLEAHMLDLSPQSSAAIREYIGAARKLTGFDLLAVPAFSSRDLPTLARYMPMMMKWGPITLDKYAERFSDPFLRRAFPLIQYDFAGIPAIVNLNFLAGCFNRTLGWPLGGSLAFARAIEKRYLGLGGEIGYRARVTEVLVENDCAVGVRLENGHEERADIVVSAGDGHNTIYGLLKGRYVDDRIAAYYAAAPEAQDMNLTVSLGVARDMSHEPHALTYLFEQPRTIGGEQRDRISVEVFNFDSSMAPAGKTAIKVPLKGKYAHWKGLRDDRARYDEVKQRLGQEVIAALEHRFPGLAAQVEVVDVATPVTVERYTGNWQGLQAWGAPTGGMMTMVKGLSRTLPGLEGFHMVGQWAGATIGVSTAAAMGRKLVQRLCKAERRAFRTEVV